jgi:hypothetical protein
VRLPDWLIVGAAKSGTTALDASADNTLASQPTNPAVDRIAELLPDARLVYIGRDTVGGIASNVRMLGTAGLFGAPGFPADDAGRWEIVRHDSRLLDRSRY